MFNEEVKQRVKELEIEIYELQIGLDHRQDILDQDRVILKRLEKDNRDLQLLAEKT